MRDLRRLDELGLRLTELGSEIAYPSPTRDLWPAVREGIGTRRVSWWSPVARAALGAAVVLLVLAGALVVSPDARALAREILRIGGSEIIPVPGAPSPSPDASVSPAPSVSPVLILGERVTLSEAARRLERAVLVPAELGQPDEVYVRTVQGGIAVSLLYRERAGIPRSAGSGIAVLLTEARGSLEVPILTKVVEPGTRVEQLRVNGAPGAWLEGAPHQILYRDAAGQFVSDTLRLAGNTLIWEQAGLAIRIEAQVTKERALALAATVR